MVLVENLFRCLHVQPLFRPRVPRKLQHQVEIVPDDCRLGGILLLLAEPARLLEKLCFGLLGKLQGADFFLIALGIGLVVLFAQLLANDVHLLAQIVVALPLVDVLLDLLGDFVFQL